MKTTLLYIIAFATLVLSSCTGRSAAGPQGAGDSVEMRYARYLDIVKHDGFTLVKLKDPWNKGKTLHTYILVKATDAMPADIPEGTVIRTPLKKSLISTSVHCAMLISLNRAESIKGVCDLQYINIPEIKEKAQKGGITDCGSSMSPLIENVIELHPDAILLSPFQNSGGYGKLDKLGIPIIEAAEYMEATPLGRAEWIKFYGMLWDAEEAADSIFNSVESAYNELKALAATTKSKKTILMDTQTGSVWYVPGGKSTIGQLIKDAAIEYPFGNNDNSGSLQLSFETVLERAQNADIWLLRYGGKAPLTLGELKGGQPGYAQFKAFRQGEVYGCNTLTSTFYEDTPFHPERLLRDFIMIAHPELGIEGHTGYFFKLQ